MHVVKDIRNYAALNLFIMKTLLTREEMKRFRLERFQTTSERLHLHGDSGTAPTRTLMSKKEWIEQLLLKNGGQNIRRAPSLSGPL